MEGATMSPDEAKIREAWRDAPAIPACGYLYWHVMATTLTTALQASSIPTFRDSEEHAVYFYNRRNWMVIDEQEHYWNEVYGELKNTRVFIGHNCKLPDSYRLQYSPPLSGTIK